MYSFVLQNLCRVVFIYEFLGDVCEFDVHIHWVFQGSVNKVETIDVKACKTGTRSQEHAVDHKLDTFERTCRGCYLTWVTYIPTCDYDARSVEVLLFRSHFADNACQVGYLHT